MKHWIACCLALAACGGEPFEAELFGEAGAGAAGSAGSAGAGGAAGESSGGEAGEGGAAGADPCADPPELHLLCGEKCPEGWHITKLSAVTGCGDGRERTCALDCGTFHQCSLFLPCPDGTVDLGVTKHPDCELANYKDAAGNNARICEVQ